MWWSWWQRKPRLPKLEIVMYTRQGCHLCEVAWEVLKKWQRQYGFLMDAVDVDLTPDLRELYGEHVPVITIAGQWRFRGHVNEVLFKRLLEVELHRQKNNSDGNSSTQEDGCDSAGTS